MPVEGDDELREVLDAGTIAVVGCSRTPGKAAHEIPRYLLEHGYDVIPVNPNAGEIFGRVAYDSLAEIPADVDVDVVDVFRPSDEVAGIVADAVDRDDVAVVWTQLGIRDTAATRRAEEAGIKVVEDRCMKVEHARVS